MTEPARPIGEDDLHAYIDNQLSAPRRQAVEDYLANKPEEKQRIAAYRAQREALREGFAAIAAEELPPNLTLAGIVAEQRRPRRAGWLMAASILLALGVGVAGGMMLGEPSTPSRTQLAMTLLEQEALASHAVYAADRQHAVEVPGTDTRYLGQWLSGRLDRTVAPPDLSALGYRLIGGRLLATERGGAAALLMYENTGGQRISVLLRPMRPDLRASVANITNDRLGGQAWIGKGLGIAVVAALPDADLSRISADVARELGVVS